MRRVVSWVNQASQHETFREETVYALQANSKYKCQWIEGWKRKHQNLGYSKAVIEGAKQHD